MQARNFLPSYRVGIVIVAAIVVMAAVVMLFPSGDTNQRKNKEVVKENIEGAENIAPATITEETKRSLSERLPGDAIAITEETKRLLSERPPDSVPNTITPETAKSLSARPNDH